MKRTLGYIGALMIMAAGWSWGAESIAVVDMEVLIRSHPNTEADKKLLKETVREYEAERDVKRSRAKRLKEAYETAVRGMKNPALSAKELARREATAKQAAMDLEQSMRELETTMKTLQQNLTEQEVRMLKRTMAEIMTEVEEYAKEQGYATVLDSSARRLGQVPTVVYFANEADITDAILKKMGVAAAPLEAME